MDAIATIYGLRPVEHKTPPLPRSPVRWSGPLQALSKAPADLLAALMPAGDRAGRRAVVIGLVGRGIGSSRSPIMHEREGARVGLDYTYRLLDFDQLGLRDDTLADVVGRASPRD